MEVRGVCASPIEDARTREHNAPDTTGLEAAFELIATGVRATGERLVEKTLAKNPFSAKQPHGDAR